MFGQFSKGAGTLEDFFLLLLHAHIIVAAEKILEYDFRGDFLAVVAKSIVNTHLLLPSDKVDDGVVTY